MRPKWLLLMLPALIGIAAILLYALGTPSSATFARAFSTGQWKVAAMPGDLRCALIADLQHRGGPVGRVVVELIERLHATRAQWSGLAKPPPLCPDAEDADVDADGVKSASGAGPR